MSMFMTENPDGWTGTPSGVRVGSTVSWAHVVGALRGAGFVRPDETVVKFSVSVNGLTFYVERMR